MCTRTPESSAREYRVGKWGPVGINFVTLTPVKCEEFTYASAAFSCLHHVAPCLTKSILSYLIVTAIRNDGGWNLWSFVVSCSLGEWLI